ncbi:MAG: MBL fold metallo-hydrolase [Candidatus Aminicenantes bacterium]|nr:MAG: MBL fold metallo-hydrolase [Candidatus Aminicenantes bacterium]
MRNKKFINLLMMLGLLLSWLVLAQQEEPPAITIEKVSGEVYCLSGRGGNIGILKTDEGLLLVDSQFKGTADEVLKKIAGLSAKPIKYLVNTHYHGDHTDGNEVIGKDAVVVMHPNCKASLMKNQKADEPKKEYLSKVKLWKKDMVIRMGDENVRLQHFGSGHTAGDLVVVFEKSKVFHTGDLFFHGMPPYIDVKDGSDTENWIQTIETLCKEYPDYKIIPGHGQVTDPGEYLKLARYLEYLRKEVAAAIKAGKTREQAMETINLEPYQGLKDSSPFTNKKNNIGWIYDELTRQKN